MSNWYYYTQAGERIGPITVATLKLLAKQGNITPETVIENNDGKAALAGKVRGLFPERVSLRTCPEITFTTVHLCWFNDTVPLD